eukprot:11661756-Alexandrium_andersonii.AAC.1
MAASTADASLVDSPVGLEPTAGMDASGGEPAIHGTRGGPFDEVGIALTAEGSRAAACSSRLPRLARHRSH